MAEIHGDATKEEIEKKALRELKGQLVGISTERTVIIDPATAAALVELLPSDEDLAETEEEKEKFSMKAPAPAAAAKPAASAAAAAPTRAQLEAKTKEELLELADDEDVDVSHSWTKADIVDALLKARK